MEKYVIRHAGTKGMRWGVRHFQNKDGTLTPLGKLRYRKKQSSDNETEPHEDYKTKHEKKSVRELSDQELRGRVARYEAEKKYENFTEGPDRLSQTKNVIDATENATRSLKRLDDTLRSQARQNRPRLNLDNMTDKELRDKIEREVLEQRYNDMFAPSNISKGRERMSRILPVAGDVLAVTGSVVGIAAGIKLLVKK